METWRRRKGRERKRERESDSDDIERKCVSLWKSSLSLSLCGHPSAYIIFQTRSSLPFVLHTFVPSSPLWFDLPHSWSSPRSLFSPFRSKFLLQKLLSFFTSLQFFLRPEILSSSETFPHFSLLRFFFSLLKFGCFCRRTKLGGKIQIIQRSNRGEERDGQSKEEEEEGKSRFKGVANKMTRRTETLQLATICLGRCHQKTTSLSPLINTMHNTQTAFPRWKFDSQT